MSHEGKRLYPIQLQYLGWIMGIPEWSYPLDLPPNRGYRFPPRFSAVLSFRNPNLNLYLLASWEGGMKFQSIIYNPLKNNQASISTASNNQYQAIIYNTKLSSRSCILVVATMPFYNMLEIVITKWFFVQDMAPPPFSQPCGCKNPFILNLGSFDQGTVPNTMPNIKASIVAAVFKLDPTFRLRCTTWWFMGQVFDGQNPQSSPVDMEKCSIINRDFISCIIRGGEGGWNPVRITC